MRLLKPLYTFQLLLGCVWVLALTGTANPGWGALFLLVLIYPLHGAVMLVAGWSAFTRPETGRLALWMILTPIALLFVPTLLTRMLGVPVFPPRVTRVLWTAVLAGPPLFCVLRPRLVATYLPSSLLRSRIIDLGITSLLVVLLVTLAGLGFVSTFGGAGDGSRSMARLVVVGLTTGSVLCVLAAVYAYLGLFQSEIGPQRRLRVIQLVLAVPIPVVAGALFLLTLVAAQPR